MKAVVPSSAPSGVDGLRLRRVDSLAEALVVCGLVPGGTRQPAR